MEKRKIHMIGNTHIDPVWLWKRAEGFQEVKSSFASALERMKEFPDFIFTASSVSFLEWLSENCPGLFSEIRERVLEGRFEIVGGMWVEPDCILPSGESLIRHFLYSHAFLTSALGVEATVGYNVDSFGHGANLPAILSGCGIKSYLACRPDRDLFSVPPVFRWKSPSGAEVTAERTGGEYLAWTKPGIEKNLQESEEALNQYGGDRMAVFYGVGNHGGGPTIDNIKSIRELRQQRRDLELDFSRLDAFFAELKPEELPEFQGEWGRVFMGCYSSDNEIKRLNRKAEWRLLKAEAMMAMAAHFSCGTANCPMKKLSYAWKETLFNQFHDILSGTSIEPARDEACDHFRGAIAAADTLIGDAMQGIANSVDTRGDGFPLVFVNPTGTDFEGLVAADVYVPSPERKQVRLRDADGEEIPYAETEYQCYARGARKNVLFEAKIPAMGYAVYRMLLEGPNRQLEESGVFGEGLRIGNGKVEMTLDEETGCPASLKLDGREMLASPASVKVMYDDRGAWGQHHLTERVEGHFRLESSRILEKNPLRVILRSVMAYERSTLLLDYILEKSSDTVRINGTIHNCQKHAEICFAVPVAGKNHVVVNETAFLAEQKVKNDGTEYYQHRFADISSEGGIAVFNDSSYGMRQMGEEYRLILSRSSVFSRGEDGELPISAELRTMDQGQWDFCLELLPHTEAVGADRLFAAADRLHMPVECLADSNHLGTHTLRYGSAVSVRGKGVSFGCLKPAADGTGLLLRIFESLGEDTSAVVTYCGKETELPLSPYQIQSVLLGENSIIPCDMLERP